MKNEKIVNEIMELLASISGTEQHEIRLDDHLRDDLGLDSLKSMELLSRISEEYDMDVDVEDVMELETVQDIISFFERSSNG